MSVSINGTTGVTFTDASVQNTAATGFGFKNRIINGAMVIDQRNAGASVTPANGDYTLDRYRVYMTQASKFTVQQTPSATETGYAVRIAAGQNNYLACTSSSAYSILSTDYFTIRQRIEGFNFADMEWGTSSAKTVTLSFLVYSSLTGTFGGVLANSAGNRSYPFSYTIGTANTWTQISVTIAGDTTGTWIGATNGVGVQVIFSLGAGATYLGTANTWAGAEYYGVTGQTQLIATNGATFNITGVQLEKGSTATSFDYRPYGTELALCQRYFQNWNALLGANTILGIGMGNGTTACDVGYPFKVSMRSVPTITNSTVSTTFTLSPSAIAVSALSIIDSNSEIACLRFTATVSSAGGYKASASTTGAFINFSSEL